MERIEKTKEELISELNAIKKEYDSLRAKFENEITSQKRTNNTPNKNEEMLLSIASRSIPGYIAYVNANTLQYEFVNEAYEKSFGIPKEKIIGSTVKEIIGESNYKFALKYITEAKSGKTTSYENSFKLADGEQWLQVNFTPVFDNNGHVTSIVVFNFDITERKKAENKLISSEIKYRELIEQASDGIFLCDSKGNFLDINHSGCKMFGYSYEEMQKLNVEDLYQPEDKLKSLETQNKLNSEKVFIWERSMIRKDGSILPVEISGKILADGRIQAIVRDISERKRAEEKVWDAEERFRMVFENVLDGISIYSDDPDPSKRILIDCNEQYASMVGHTREELLRRGTTEDLYINNDKNSNTKRLESFKNGTSFQGTFSWIRPDGKENYIEYMGMPFKWRGQSYSIGIDRDITENKKTEEALEKERLLLRTLVDYLPSAVFIKDEQYRKILVNPVHAQCVTQQLIRYDRIQPKDILGKTDFEVYPKELAEMYLQDDQKVIRDGKTILNKEEPGIGPDGKDSWVLVSKIPLKDKNGSIKGMVGITTDITNQKLAEAALRESEEKFRAAFENAPMGMSMILPNGQYLAVNPVLCKMFGYSEKELLSGTINKITHPDDIERGNKWILKMISGDRSEPEFEKRYIHKDGHIVWGLVRAEWIKDKAGTVKMSVVHILDITERKKVEEALTKSEALYRDLVETSQDLIWQCDADGKYTYLNHSWEEIFGYKIEEMIGRKFSDFQTSEYANSDSKGFKRLISSNVVKGFETIHIGKAGNEIHLVFNAISIKEENNNIIGIRGTAYDISKRKKAEEEIIKTNNELQRINSVKDKFFSIIAHDLKSPFQGLVGMTGMMADDINSFSQQELSEFSLQMHKNVKNLLKLLTNLLDWARMQQGTIRYDPIDLLLSDVISRNVNLLSKSREQKGIEIIIDLPNNHIIYADEEMLNSILGNLISNAVKFTSKGGRIKISAIEIENNMIEIAIQDNGIGMLESLTERLFKMEERVGRIGTDGEESTGLGLLLCKEFVEKHGGTIWVKTKENEGSTFYFTLPKFDINLTIQ